MLRKVETNSIPIRYQHRSLDLAIPHTQPDMATALEHEFGRNEYVAAIHLNSKRILFLQHTTSWTFDLTLLTDEVTFC
jgi:hypothetical protein